MCLLYQQSRDFTEKGDSTSAIEVLTAGLNREPYSSDFLYDLCVLYAQSGKYMEALRMLSDGLKLYPENTRMMRKCAEILTAVGLKEDAEYFTAVANR
jgi:tetratricopeptide (TPR) repeat protein